MALWIGTLAISYLIGAIPTGLLLGCWLSGVDLRDYGSGKTGATNVGRLLGWKGFAFVALADVAKGALAVLVARLLLGNTAGEVAAALAAVTGHNWPLYTGFRGGRGVATSFGGLAMMAPLIALFCVLVFGIVLFVSRYVSLGSLLAALLTLAVIVVLTLLGATPLDYGVYGLVGAALIVFQHRDNIVRLWAGTERRLRGFPFL